MTNYATNNLGILKIKCQQLIQLAKKNSNNVNWNDMMQKKKKPKKHMKLFFKKNENDRMGEDGGRR